MSGKPFIARFMDGRDAVGTPWESEGPNSPVFVHSFIDFEGRPFVLSTDGSLFRMLPSKGNNSPYTLESAEDDPESTSILMYGGSTTEDWAVSLL